MAKTFARLQPYQTVVKNDHGFRLLISAKQIYVHFEKWLLPLGVCVVILGIWELAPAMGWVNPLLVSSPSRIFQAAMWLFTHGFIEDIKISAIEFGLGTGLAIASDCH